MGISVEKQYEELVNRLSSLRERRAVLVSKEAEKEVRRTELEGYLREAGIDLSNPVAELTRLNDELTENYQVADQAVTEFETALEKIESGVIAELEIESHNEEIALVVDEVCSLNPDGDGLEIIE